MTPEEEKAAASAQVVQGVPTTKVEERVYNAELVKSVSMTIDQLAEKLATFSADELPQPLRVSNVPIPLQKDGYTYDGTIANGAAFTFTDDGNEDKRKVYAKVLVNHVVDGQIKSFAVKVNMANRLEDLKNKTLREGMPVPIEVREYIIYPKGSDGKPDESQTPNKGFWALAL